MPLALVLTAVAPLPGWAETPVGVLHAPRVASHPAPPLHYIGSVALYPDGGVLAAGWTILVEDPAVSTLDLLLSGSFGGVSVSGSGVVSAASAPDAGLGPDIRRHSIVLTPPAPDTPRIVKLAYSGPLDGGGLPINTVDPEKIELTVDSFWFPFDARFDTPITADVQLRVDGDWTALGVGTVSRTPKGYRLEQSRPGLDVATVLLKTTQTRRVDGITVHDARRDPGSNVPELFTAIRDCAGWLNALAGPAGPLPPTTVVVTNRADGGWSRGSLIALTDIENEDEEALRQFVCHELAHHWSRANAGGPDNWINEGVADHLANMALRDAMGEAVYRARLDRYSEALTSAGLPPLWTPGTTRKPSHLGLYRAAPLALADLEDRMGRAPFRSLMRVVMTEEVGDTDRFLALVEREAGKEMRDWFEARLAR
ncbi:MAG: hypothetical protein WBG08_05925 [Litorimonas sp.]